MQSLTPAQTPLQNYGMEFLNHVLLSDCLIVQWTLNILVNKMVNNDHKEIYKRAY